MSARELRAEARAWRRRARAIRGGPAGYVYVPNNSSSANAMYLRLESRIVQDDTEYMDREAAVWFCLILALECEDEARALGRGGR